MLDMICVLTIFVVSFLFFEKLRRPVTEPVRTEKFQPYADALQQAEDIKNYGRL